MRSLLLILLCAGCPKNRQAAVDLLAPLLAEADAAWDARGRDGLDPVDAALQRAYALRPQSPAVAWRLARVGVARGLTLDEPAARVAAFGAARAQAWQCVLDDPRVHALRLESGLEEALASIPEERELCATWAGHAWARWMVEFGAPGATLDLQDLDPLLAHARQSGADAWLTAWTDALLLAERPDWIGGDAEAATTGLRAVIKQRPDHVEPLVDLYLYVARGTEAEASTRDTLAGAQPDTPEERAYVKRALDLGATRKGNSPAGPQ
ncbi:MAG: hypothetical protein R3F61_37235 [Myxococcota bacterium]